MHRLLLSVLLCLLTLPAVATERTVLVLGDSLSAAYGIDREEGWVALLRERLDDNGYPARVVNASVSGHTTANGVDLLPQALAEHQPDAVIIALGGNDGLRGVALAEMRRNLTRMVRLSREAGAQVLLVGVRLPSNYGRAFIDRFQAVFREVAESEGVPLVPRFLEGVGGNAELMQSDGIHPNAAAQPVLLDNVWGELKPLLGGGA
ncbi:arylesterase [Sediminicurvatus halobius]|uniref:Arylesterase n=1 Tax=Sediminicurvatus halobius TaxID=2182432 RepID=A0A2U2N176_9GAMM|nr:arylesterase [Spiribacter halobius]PWG63001.1 arylesterase [Spiribacter halobius]UEX77520.1 arylesterase [Spiribacter halobius]